MASTPSIVAIILSTFRQSSYGWRFNATPSTRCTNCSGRDLWCRPEFRYRCLRDVDDRCHRIIKLWYARSLSAEYRFTKDPEHNFWRSVYYVDASSNLHIRVSKWIYILAGNSKSNYVHTSLDDKALNVPGGLVWCLSASWCMPLPPPTGPWTFIL